MNAMNAMNASEAAPSVVGNLVEVSFPAWPSQAWVANAVALTAPRVWATQREAVRAAAIVGGLVGVPALIAASAVLALFVLTAFVLLAPLVAAALVWLAWRCNRVGSEDPPAAARLRRPWEGARRSVG